ncbi:hypothetical protein SB766_09880 [Pseudomonas sp. SIMBA_077]
MTNPPRVEGQAWLVGAAVANRLFEVLSEGQTESKAALQMINSFSIG